MHSVIEDYLFTIKSRFNKATEFCSRKLLMQFNEIAVILVIFDYVTKIAFYSRKFLQLSLKKALVK